MFDLAVIALTFGPVFVVELADKTFLATLVLSTRYRPLLVWMGVGLALGLQAVISVAAGSVVGLLPTIAVQLATLILFLAGAVILFRTAADADHGHEQEVGGSASAGELRTGWRAVGASFLVLFAAEWGDFSQLTTVSRSAEYGEPLSVFVGAWGAELTVASLAVIVGHLLLARVRLAVLHYVGSAVCLAFAGYTLSRLLT